VRRTLGYTEETIIIVSIGVKKVNREWLSGANKNTEYRILTIDTDRLDFAQIAASRNELVERVIKIALV
jgi:hypothetical protein